MMQYLVLLCRSYVIRGTHQFSRLRLLCNGRSTRSVQPIFPIGLTVPGKGVAVVLMSGVNTVRLTL